MALLVLCGSVPAASAGPTVAATSLDNGLKVIVMENHSAELVAVEVWVKAGNLYETRANNGVAHFLEHVLFKGTAKRGPGQADRDIEALGSTLDATSSRDAIRINTTVASKQFDIALEVLTDVTMRAKLDPQDIERERTVILDEQARRDAEPLQTVMGLVSKVAFPDHPYGFPIEGSASNVKTITAEQIREFYRTYFVPNNMAVIVVGDVDPARATDAIRKAFGEFKKKDLPARAAAAQAAPTARTEKVKRDTKLTYCAISFPAPGIANPADVCALDVLLTYLVVGYQSWMESDLKASKGLVQMVAGEFTTHLDPGNFALMFGANPESVEEVRQAVFAKLKVLQETPLSDAELARAKRSLEGSFAFDVETFSGKAHSLGFYESLGDYTFSLTYIENIRKVTPDQIREVASKYLKPEAASIVEVGP